MNNNLPKPPVAQRGKAPQVGQWAPYLEDDGTLWPGIITSVGESSPDGKWYNVGAIYLKGGTPVTGEWQYDVATAEVTYNPPGPPWP
jgi:hypothetical protein